MADTAKSTKTLKLDDKYKNEVIGYNFSGQPLGERDDLILLYDMSARNKNYLKFFSETPDKAEAERLRTEYFNNKRT